MTKKYGFPISWAILAGILLLFYGCAGTEKPDKSGKHVGNIKESLESLAKRFPKIPFPNGYELDRSKSFLYESKDGRIKTGHLYLDGKEAPESAIGFYSSEMAKRGWKLIRTVEQETVIMVYEQGGEICTVAILKAKEGTRLDIQFRPG